MIRSELLRYVVGTRCASRKLAYLPSLRAPDAQGLLASRSITQRDGYDDGDGEGDDDSSTEASCVPHRTSTPPPSLLIIATQVWCHSRIKKPASAACRFARGSFGAGVGCVCGWMWNMGRNLKDVCHGYGGLPSLSWIELRGQEPKKNSSLLYCTFR